MIRSTQARVPVRKWSAALVAGFILSALLITTIGSAGAAETVTISPPDCGNDATLTLNAGDSGQTDFVIRTAGSITPLLSVYVRGHHVAQLRIPLASTTPLRVEANGNLLLSQEVAPSTTMCSVGTELAPVTHYDFGASIGNSSGCNSRVPVAIQNGFDGTRWFEVWSGRSSPDVIIAAGGLQSFSVTDDLVSGRQTRNSAQQKQRNVSVVWNNEVLTSKSVAVLPACSSTTPASETTTTTAPTTTTTVPETTTTAEPTTTTTVPAPTTTAAPTTVPAPPSCAPTDSLAGWGCPTAAYNFDTPSLDGWTVYGPADNKSAKAASNVTVSGGQLQVSGTYDGATASLTGGGLAMTSNQKFGRWEVRARIEAGTGLSPVALLWPASENSGVDGEIDMFEVPFGDRNQFMSFIHMDSPVPQNTPSHLTRNTGTEWHTYTVEWTPSSVSMAVDGTPYLVTTDPGWIPHGGPMHLALQEDAPDPGYNCKTGGWWPCVDGTTPAKTTMYVDWVKVWQQP